MRSVLVQCHANMKADMLVMTLKWLPNRHTITISSGYQAPFPGGVLPDAPRDAARRGGVLGAAVQPKGVGAGGRGDLVAALHAGAGQGVVRADAGAGAGRGLMPRAAALRSWPRGVRAALETGPPPHQRGCQGPRHPSFASCVEAVYSRSLMRCCLFELCALALTCVARVH